MTPYMLLGVEDLLQWNDVLHDGFILRAMVGAGMAVNNRVLKRGVLHKALSLMEGLR